MAHAYIYIVYIPVIGSVCSVLIPRSALIALQLVTALSCAEETCSPASKAASTTERSRPVEYMLPAAFDTSCLLTVKFCVTVNQMLLVCSCRVCSVFPRIDLRKLVWLSCCAVLFNGMLSSLYGPAIIKWIPDVNLGDAHAHGVLFCSLTAGSIECVGKSLHVSKRYIYTCIIYVAVAGGKRTYSILYWLNIISSHTL